MQEILEWKEFTGAIAIFFLSHTIPVRPSMKRRVVAKIGTVGFTIAYSLLSAFVLTWIILAAGRAPYVELWGWSAWQNQVPLIGMALASVIIAMAFGRPNPLSFGGWNNTRFDPEAPGIIGWMHHPLLVTLMIWSGAHMVPNGDLAHVIVFGMFVGFAILGMKIIDRRSRRILGETEWKRLSATRQQIRITKDGVTRVIAGLLIYLAILYSHEWIFGVSPLL